MVKTDLRVLKTQMALENAFLELLSEKTLEKISLKELVDHAVVGKGTFYLHYKDLDSFSEKIVTKSLQEYRDSLCFKLTSYQKGKSLLELVLPLEQKYQILLAVPGYKQKFTLTLRQILSEHFVEADFLLGIDLFAENIAGILALLRNGNLPSDLEQIQESLANYDHFLHKYLFL